jgi:hypothetical protein
MATAPTIQPNQRYLLYAITYLLSTPSYLAQLVDSQGDVPQWLETEAGITDSTELNLCLGFINTVKSAIVSYAFMSATRNSLRLVGQTMPGMYDSPICPTRAESAQIMKAMSQMAAPALAPAKHMAAAANGGTGTVIHHSGNIMIALSGDK